MPKFPIRQNCEYSIEVEAVDLDEAYKKAAATPKENWEQAWSSIEIDEEK